MDIHRIVVRVCPKSTGSPNALTRLGRLSTSIITRSALRRCSVSWSCRCAIAVPCGLRRTTTDETASVYRRHVYEFQAIDVIVLEGIYLLERAFQADYDLSLWIDCTFDTALEAR